MTPKRRQTPLAAMVIIVGWDPYQSSSKGAAGTSTQVYQVADLISSRRTSFSFDDTNHNTGEEDVRQLGVPALLSRGSAKPLSHYVPQIRTDVEVSVTSHIGIGTAHRRASSAVSMASRFAGLS
ncbi:hypothetical protein BP6252_02587 [Coleophoma cylindrospora]|uniref:Uncharacterized protein n=1 Tax=Coleophoma cylindrospora TaxID=1849047 RepID=A0A3D8SF75_9HELO|nr:hypothetical protein BP6252_02587 [Coleophoma cylindrospora]